MRARMRRGALNPISCFSIGILCLSCIARADAQPSVRYYTENGVTYKETRSTVRRPVVEKRMEQREKTVYREKISRGDKSGFAQLAAGSRVRAWAPLGQRKF